MAKVIWSIIVKKKYTNWNWYVEIEFHNKNNYEGKIIDERIYVDQLLYAT